MTDVNEWIKERRRIHAKGSSGRRDADDKDWDDPYDTTLVYDVFHNGDTIDRDHVADASYDNAEVIVDAHNTLPALLTAVEKVLELHTESVMQRKVPLLFRETEEDDLPFTYCIACEDKWPCATVRAIEGAINE